MRGTCSILVIVTAGGLGTACGGGECLDGTVRFHDTCVIVDPFDKTPPVITVDPPLRTRSVGNITLTSNEPAEIFVTTDQLDPTADSQHEPDDLLILNDRDDVVLKYFAVDAAGNKSDVQTVSWEIDREGPPPPNQFKLTLAGTSRSVGWVPPVDQFYGGLLVARVEGRLLAQPIDGVTYALGDSVGPGATLVHVGGPETTAGSFSESMPTSPGLVRYVGWAFDNLHNYSAPAGDFALIDLGTQTAALTANTAGTVAITTPASHVTLTGTTTFNAGTLTVQLTMRNDSTRVLHAPKLLLTTTLPTGVSFANADGTVDTFPFRAYGAALQPGEPRTVTWTFTGVPAGSFDVSVTVKDNPLIMMTNGTPATGGDVNDFATGQRVLALSSGPAGPRGGGGTSAGGFTLDGTVVFGSRTNGTLTSWDLSNGTKLTSKELRPQKAHTSQIVLDRSGSSGYALVAFNHMEGAYRSGARVATELVQFDVATLSEHRKLSIGESRNRDLRISNDGKLMLISTGLTNPGVLVVDLETFKIVRNLTSSNRPEGAVFGPDDKTVAVAGTTLELFDGRAGGPPTRVLPIPQSSGRVFRVAFNGPNELWVGKRNSVVKFDLSTNTPTTNIFVFGARALDVFDGKIYSGNGSLVRFDSAGTQDLSYTITNQRGHWLGRSAF